MQKAQFSPFTLHNTHIINKKTIIKMKEQPKTVEVHLMIQDYHLNLPTIRKDTLLNLPTMWIDTTPSLQTMIQMKTLPMWGLDRCNLMSTTGRRVLLRVDQIWRGNKTVTATIKMNDYK